MSTGHLNRSAGTSPGPGRLTVRNVSRPGRGMVSPDFCRMWHDEPVRVVGRPVFAEVERTPHLEKLDHVWITLEVPGAGSVQLSVNTRSMRNANTGFDGRIRVGVCRLPYHRRPPLGVFPARLLDYEVIEQNANIFYETMERLELEEFLISRTRAAGVVQAWGVAYCRRYLGVHQIHSRRASCAVPYDLRGMDGALRFYYEDRQEAELALFKFCGQP